MPFVDVTVADRKPGLISALAASGISGPGTARLPRFLPPRPAPSTADTEMYFGSGPLTQRVAYSADGAKLRAIGCNDGTIRIWSLTVGK